MAFDIKSLGYDAPRRVLQGRSRAVAGDRYQLRIYVPDGFQAQRVEASDRITPAMRAEGNLLAVNFQSATGNDVDWKVFF
jgi:hypothetical protein